MSRAVWVDCHSTPGYLGGWSADLGVYKGPWPFYWPPSVNPDGHRDGEVDFYVMLPNPRNDNVGWVGDDSYDTYVYATELYEPGDAGSTDMYNDWLGPTLTDSPMPPVQQKGAHLYVSVYNGTVPTFTPESLVPNSYGGTNPLEWTPGQWSTRQAASTEPGSGYSGGYENGPAASFKANMGGYTNNVDWAAMTGLTFTSLPFPPIAVRGTEPLLDAAIAAAYPPPGSFTGGMLHSWSVKHGYDPGDGTNIKAVDGGPFSGVGQGPSGTMQLGQQHQAREVFLNPSQQPKFFNTGFGTVWVYEPWQENNVSWDPSGFATMSFDDLVGWSLTTAGGTDYVGPQPSSGPAPQVINFYARQTTPPLAMRTDPGDGFPGNMQNTNGLFHLGSITVTFDFSSGTYSAPSVVNLPMSTLPLTADGTHYWGIEVIIEPAVWHGGVGIIEVDDIDAGAIPGNSFVDHDSHYGFDCYLTDQNFPWHIHFPPFRYWMPGVRIPSIGARGIGNGKWDPRVVAYVP